MSRRNRKWTRDALLKLIAEHGTHAAAARAANVQRSDFRKLAKRYEIENERGYKPKTGNEAWKALGR